MNLRRASILAIVGAAMALGETDAVAQRFNRQDRGNRQDRQNRSERRIRQNRLGRQNVQNAQNYQYGQNQYSGGTGYHIDRQNHIVRDRYGNVIGRYHRDVIHQNSTHIVPHMNGRYHGSYTVRNGNYYYYPQSNQYPTTQHQVYSPVQVQFGSFSHVDDLASRLETLANEVCLDLHYNYSHNPGFAQTYREAFAVLQAAKYIRAAQHQHDRNGIRERLGGLDQLFHHVQSDVRGWSRHNNRQVGQLGIHSKIDLVESTLHHLMNDVGVGSGAGPGAARLGPAPAPAPDEGQPLPTPSGLQPTPAQGKFAP